MRLPREREFFRYAAGLGGFYRRFGLSGNSSGTAARGHLRSDEPACPTRLAPAVPESSVPLPVRLLFSLEATKVHDTQCAASHRVTVQGDPSIDRNTPPSNELPSRSRPLSAAIETICRCWFRSGSAPHVWTHERCLRSRFFATLHTAAVSRPNPSTGAPEPHPPAFR
jgi:hypothetical protein